jgi:hypothetical protein
MAFPFSIRYGVRKADEMHNAKAQRKAKDAKSCLEFLRDLAVPFASLRSFFTAFFSGIPVANVDGEVISGFAGRFNRTFRLESSPRCQYQSVEDQ